MNQELQQKIIQEFDLVNLESKSQDDAVNRIGQLLIDRLVLESLSALDDVTQDKFNEILDNKPDPDKVISFLQKNVPNFYDLWDEIFSAIKTDFINLKG